MLNDKIRTSELLSGIDKFIDTIEIITNQILGVDPTRPLRNNKTMLGKIHHALNISEYKKSEFRKSLLLRAEDNLLLPFLQKVNLTTKSTLDPSERMSLINEASKRPWGNNNDTKAFVDIFGYDESLIPKEKEVKDEVEIIKNVSEGPFKTLYEFQSAIFFEADDLIETKDTRFIIQLPTGAGKTRIAMEIVSHFLNREIDIDKERRVIWLADQEELCEQAIESFKEIWTHLGKKNAKLYRLWANYKPKIFEKTSLIVATYQTLNNYKVNNKLPECDLIVCDEAHNVTAPTYEPLVEELAESGARVIGLTATPIRGIETSENKELLKFFNKQIVDLLSTNVAPSAENAIEYLQGEGYLAYYRTHEIDTQYIKFDIPTDILRLISQSRDMPKKYLEIIAENNERNTKIATALYELGKQKRRVLYFGTNRYQAKLTCAVLIICGISAAYVDGNTPGDYRKDVIKKFKTGTINVICNCDVFTTGFDEPKIDVIMLGRPTQSIVLHQQMIGRGMRGPKMGGTDIFDLYRINDNLPSVIVADSYFTDIWKS